MFHHNLSLNQYSFRSFFKVFCLGRTAPYWPCVRQMFRTLDEFLTRALDWVSNIFGKRRRGICLSLAFVHLCENTRTVQRNHIVRLNSRNHIHICYCFQISCIHTLNIGSRRDLSFLIGRNFHDVIIRSIHSERRWAALHPVSTPWLVNTLSLSLCFRHAQYEKAKHKHARLYIYKKQ